MYIPIDEVFLDKYNVDKGNWLMTSYRKVWKKRPVAETPNKDMEMMIDKNEGENVIYWHK